MQALLALVRAELKLHFSNRRAVLLSIVAPILIAAFFGSLFGTGSKTAGIAVGVVDLDGSPLSQRVVAALQAEASLKTTVASESDALAKVRAGKLRAVAVLPKGLGEQAAGAMFGGASKPEITLHYDPSQASALAIVRGMLAQTLMQEIGRTAGPPAASATKAGGLAMPYTTRAVEAVQSAANAQPVAYNSYAHAFAGMGVQFILMSGIDMAVGLLLMRRLGLWKRLLAAPLSRTQLLGSRVLASALISLIVFVIIYAVAIAAFGVRVHGSAAGFGLVLVCFSLLTASFGLLVAALGRTPEATRGLAILATLLMVMLGGAWVPAFLFPEWLQTASLAVPTRWAVDALDAMTWRGLGFGEAVLPSLVMLGFTAAFMALAVWRFRWEE
jgi:ABC-2 type transport system permease protein